MKIAIIGSGISGLTAAYLLCRHHQVSLFETQANLGGHTATKSVEVKGRSYDIDTGFIVFNDWTYPHFITLLNRLGVAYQPTTMGFSVFDPYSGFEYSGENLNSLFADRRNLLALNHWRMLGEILRFNKESVVDWQSGTLASSLTLGQYLDQRHYSRVFRQRYLVPMGSAIWSASHDDMEAFPFQFFVQFFHNHGLLSVNKRPTWQVIKGGSKNYLPALVAPFRQSIRCGDGVRCVTRNNGGVELLSDSGQHQFDEVIFACHSDQALNIIADTSAQERAVLSAIRYRENDVTLHTDLRFLPRRRRAWASWNYCLKEQTDELPTLTYNMNLLQNIQSDTTFCVTLNARSKIAKESILGEYQYAHPIFDLAAINAQNSWQSINGVNGTWFVGAYWFNGFHEDGVRSAVRVAEALGGDAL